MVHSQKLMVAFRQGNKRMFIMQFVRGRRAKNNMLLKYIRHRFWCSRIDRDTCKASTDLEEGIVPRILEKWSKCGLRNN